MKWIQKKKSRPSMEGEKEEKITEGPQQVAEMQNEEENAAKVNIDEEEKIAEKETPWLRHRRTPAPSAALP